jgi:hypothetical protein
VETWAATTETRTMKTTRKHFQIWKNPINCNPTVRFAFLTTGSRQDVVARGKDWGGLLLY